MQTVAMQDLQANLNNYIGQVKNGKELILTEGEQEVAIVIPITPERRLLAGLVKEDKARQGYGKPTGISGINMTGQPLSETVLGQR